MWAAARAIETDAEWDVTVDNANVALEMRSANDVIDAEAALNMTTIQYAKAFPGMRINSMDPGLTNTDLRSVRR